MNSLLSKHSIPFQITLQHRTTPNITFEHQSRTESIRGTFQSINNSRCKTLTEKPPSLPQLLAPKIVPSRASTQMALLPQLRQPPLVSKWMNRHIPLHPQRHTHPANEPLVPNHQSFTLTTTSFSSLLPRHPFPTLRSSTQDHVAKSRDPPAAPRENSPGRRPHRAWTGPYPRTASTTPTTTKPSRGAFPWSKGTWMRKHVWNTSASHLILVPKVQQPTAGHRASPPRPISTTGSPCRLNARTVQAAAKISELICREGSRIMLGK